MAQTPINQGSDRAVSPPAIPDHELICRIGVGSYGEVWMARSTTGALRAVKVVHQESFDSPRPYEREFEGISHFEPISRADPGLVDILHVGRTPENSSFYYVMELADNANGHGKSTGLQSPDTGRYEPLTLETLLRREGGRLPVQRCVTMAISLARALAHLHQTRLVHRDIKPSNIIFVDGVAKLADVGLVARLEERASFVGTEGFVPPEGPGTARADIYALGKCLYEAAMGRDRQEFPSPPTQLQEMPDRAELLELNEIIVKACDPDPERRYQNGREMLQELDLLSQGRSVREFRARRTWLRRSGWGFGVILIAAAGLVLWQQWEPEPSDPRVTRTSGYSLSVREVQLPFGENHLAGFVQVDNDKEPELILTTDRGVVAVVSLDGHVLYSKDRGSAYSGLVFNRFEDSDSDGIDEWFGVQPDANHFIGLAFNSGFNEIKKFVFPNHRTRSPTGAERHSYLRSYGTLPAQSGLPQQALFIWTHASTNFVRHLSALDWETGRELWRYPVTGMGEDLLKHDVDGDGILDILFTTGAAFNGYADEQGRNDSTVYVTALRNDGKEMWCRPFAPHFCGQSLHVASIDGREHIYARASRDPSLRAATGWAEAGFARLARFSPTGEILASYQATNHLYDMGLAALEPKSAPVLLAPDSEGCLEIFHPLTLNLLRRVEVTRPKEGCWVQLRLIGIADLDGDGFMEVALGSQQHQFVRGDSLGRPEQGINIERTLDNQVIILDHSLKQVASFLASHLRKDRSPLRAAAIVYNRLLNCQEVGFVDQGAVFLRLSK
jgi:serine/threonine protein kinase